MNRVDAISSHTQVLVIGGGPAGSNAATLLVREGFEVTLIEREVFPREHIGESLLPSCLEFLNLSGAREKVELYGFRRKYGSYFEWGAEQWELPFTDLAGNYQHSFQVVRAEYDQILLEHAKSQGVKVYEGVEVRGVEFAGERPCKAIVRDTKGSGQERSIAFDVLIDASGRAGILSTRYLHNRRYNKAFQNVALWGYWEGTKQLEKGPEGAIGIASLPDGWFWAIPLHNGLHSIGLVVHKTTFQEKRKQFPSLEAYYLDAMQECSLIADLVAGGKLVTPLKTEQDYSYSCEGTAGPGYFIVGDAACFLDPLLSTGVHLASFSALLCAASVNSLLRGEITEQQAAAFYNRSYEQAYLRFLVLVFDVYQQYKGKESYFWSAQALTRHDYNSTNLRQAFLHVVTGIEDLKDSEEEMDQRILSETSRIYGERMALLEKERGDQWTSMKEEEKEEIEAKIKLFKSLVLPPSMSPQTATEGLYVSLKPSVRLCRTQDTPSVVSASTASTGQADVEG